MTFCEDAPCCGCCDPRERGWYDDPSEYYYDLDTEYGIGRYDDEPDPIDPADCTHGNVDFSGFNAECQDCESLGLHVVNNWPIDGDPDPETPDFILWP